MTSITDLAIKAALNQDWDQAVELNQQILSEKPGDIPTLNRLAFAFGQSGQVSDAKKTYQKVLEQDAYNPIAKKNLDKLSSATASFKSNSKNVFITSFIEEPGKTKTVPLLRPAGSDLLSVLNPGMTLNLSNKKRRLIAETLDGKYVGCFPDDVGFRLIKLLNVGYQYQTIIKAVESKSICVFIKETTKGNSGYTHKSFISNSNHNLSLPKTQNLEEVPIDITPTGEEHQD